MTYVKPCADRANDPNDWFISKDGRQYSDEDITDEAKRESLIRRRHAKDACHVDCYFRLQCLDKALEDQPEHGTWGGYFEEELKVLYIKINHRKNRQERG